MFVCLSESKVNDVIGALSRPQGLLVPIDRCQVSTMFCQSKGKSQGGGGGILGGFEIFDSGIILGGSS